ncbi:hypothetical protein ACPW96_03085 [Micromonospora sp. DT81.3]|uniref:hypothetical protein n=1 Tax=Micromonospora sp. DT81.3 TaxID=3416523 RepID=UPI003CEBE8F1
MKKNTKRVLGVGAAALVAMSLGAAPAMAHDPEPSPGKNVVLTATLTELNGSGASGKAIAVVRDETIRAIGIRARGLSPNAPHAQHIHYGEQALNECPTLALDSNGDGRLNTVEGVPAYGPVVVSLNTSGDTSPASFLDVTRFPVSKNGTYNYFRRNIAFTDVAGTGYPGAGGTGTAAQIAEAIRAAEGVVVIHGNDYDGNGAYNLSDPEGASELDPSLPAEATDPVACGLLH